MKESISKRDWEMISAYLDGQLSERKHSHFQARLHQEPHLQQAFEEIRRTRQILRNTPGLRAPRNFLLTPQMAGQQQRMSHLSPIFGWASAVASFLLVLVLVGDIFSTGGAIPVVFKNIPSQVEQATPSLYGVAQDRAADADTAAAPAPVEGEAAGKYSETVEAELPAEEPSAEVASAPEMEAAAEAAPVELATTPEPELTPTKDIEIIVSGSASGETTRSPEITSEAAPAGENNGVVFMPPSETEGAEPPEAVAEAQTLDEAVTQTFTLTITATQLVEMGAEPSTEVALWEEASQTPAERAVEITPQPEPLALEPGPTLGMEAEASEPSSEEPQVEEKTEDFLLGAEVILALLAAGLGISWLFMRRRGG